ncbi:hypothetical protein FRC06_002221 [Ceratobasidium sp. 370]|nr:hypothetical protein FRC06_002221 [Ceratobasidium sp. 370]
MTPSTMRKGKRTAPALPRAAIGLIVDHAAAAAGGFAPASVSGDSWGARVWLVLQRVRALHALRAVSRAWRDVVDSHPAWRPLCAMLDPHALHARPPPTPAPAMVPSQAPYNAETFRRITRATCIVCAVTCPDSATFRRRAVRQPPVPTSPALSALMGPVYTCAVHRQLAFCARCLRAEPSSLGLLAAPCLSLAPLAANERDADLTRGLDLRAGAGVRAVCGSCREERIKFELMRGRGVHMAPWMGSGFWEWEWDHGGGDSGGWAPLWADGTLRQRDAARLVRNEDVAGVVTQYVEFGDWTIREAIEEMEERVWMRWWTKAGEMEGLVRATARMQRMEERAEEIREREAARARQEDLRRQVLAAGGGDLGPGLDILPDEFADDESDEDDDLLSLSDEFGLREMIFQDWARNRILEGIWLSPHTDMNRYYSAATNNPEMRTLPARVAPHHPLGAPRAPPTLPRPFPWTVLAPLDDRRSYAHVPANFYLSTPPPPSRLSYHLARAWEGALRSVLGPALSNIVARIVAECDIADRLYSQLQSRDQRDRAYTRLRARCSLALGERDPCRAVTRIGADRIVEILRGPEPWVEGGGWEDAGMLAEMVLEDDASDEDGQSDLASCTPSPEALQSPSTMRTTPSPPPSVDGTKRGSSASISVVDGTPVMGVLDTELEPEAADEAQPQTQTQTQTQLRAPIIPVLPKLPKPLHSIPLIPTCTYHIGQQTKLVIELLWRESTGGLWMCRCTVCVRAMAVQGVPSVPSVPQTQTQTQEQVVNTGGEAWDVPMEVHVEEQEVEGKGKGVAGRRSRERDGDEYVGGERKRIKCEEA